MATGYPPMPPSHSAHPSLDGFRHPHTLQHGPNVHSHSHLHAHLAQAQGQTCVPSLIPPGIDPAQVDIRTFYPYQPNEVKHRKRTTRQQLKVLENVYGYDTKPNATLRKKLAEELGMTARGVQVWFQNRRAKEKNQAKKMDGGLAGAGLPSTSTDSPSTPAAALPPSNADGHASEAESSTASAVRGSAAEGTTQDSSSPGASDHPSLSSLPTVPAVPAVGDLDGSSHGPTTDAREDGSASSLSSFHDDGSPREFGRLMIPAHAGGSSSMNPSAAELLAARRPSLPILNLPSSHNGLRRMPSSLSGKGLPKGFDPHERRKSVDTMSANLRRLSTHPYAHLAAANVSVNGHNTGPGHSYGSAPGLLVRRSISHTGPGLSGLEEVQDWLSSGPSSAPSRVPQSANSRTYYLTPTPTHSQIHSPSQNGPNTSQRGPAPPFAGQQQQQSSPPSAHPSTSYSGMSFVNPWQQQSQPSTAVSPSIQAAGFGPSVSPHDMQPPSPGSSAPPLPISQTSYNGSMLAHSVSRRYAADGHGRLQEHQHHSHHHDLGLHMANYAISSRPMPAPLPGPLPDEHFSFGLPASTPASSGSSTSTSPIASDATLSMMSHGGGVMEEEADDASAVSSTYDPQSRFGSLASVASTESSWTSAYWSDAEGRKLSVSAPDGYDGERKGSIASGYLPQLFGELDVNGGSTPQPPGEGGIPPEQGSSRRGSSGSLHDHSNFSEAYAVSQEYHDSSIQHDGFGSHDQSSYMPTPSDAAQYAAEHGSYSPSSTISARSQGAADGKHADEHHTGSPPMPQHSHSSELMYALHHSPGNENTTSASDSSLSYNADLNASLANTSDHHLSPHQPHQHYSTLSPKQPHYPLFAHQGEASPYDMSPPHLQSTYSSPPMNLGYHMFQGTPIYDNGAVDLGSMCIPASMDGTVMGDYLQS